MNKPSRNQSPQMQTIITLNTKQHININFFELVLFSHPPILRSAPLSITPQALSDVEEGVVENTAVLGVFLEVQNGDLYLELFF